MNFKLRCQHSGGFHNYTGAFSRVIPDRYMHGNVWEWCLDDWHQNYQGAPMDGKAWIGKDPEDDRVSLSTEVFRKTVRGGCWFRPPKDCRSASRLPLPSYYQGDDVGFRVVCEVPQA